MVEHIRQVSKTESTFGPDIVDIDLSVPKTQVLAGTSTEMFDAVLDATHDAVVKISMARAATGGNASSNVSHAIYVSAGTGGTTLYLFIQTRAGSSVSANIKDVLVRVPAGMWLRIVTHDFNQNDYNGRIQGGLLGA